MTGASSSRTLLGLAFLLSVGCGDSSESDSGSGGASEGGERSSIDGTGSSNSGADQAAGGTGATDSELPPVTGPDTCAEARDALPDVDDPYASELIAVRALGDLGAPVLYDGTATTEATLSAGELQTVFYDGLDYQGSATKVFAWVGIPESATAAAPVPAMVLVHGGGGSANLVWVERWVDRGYAAISMAVEGQGDGTETHDWSGPSRSGIYGDSDQPLEDQFMYHAVADTILAGALLRDHELIDEQRVGVMGVSWGGVITSTVMGIDDRFSLAIPTYGCGDMDSAENWWGNNLKNNELYQKVWDPMVRMHRATMPSLWLSWPEDNNFPMDRFAVSYRATPGERMVALVPGMRHGHAPAFNRPESYAFAESVYAGGPWCQQLDVQNDDGAVTVRFDSSVTLTGATLVSTVDTGVTGDRTWVEGAATVVDRGEGIWEASATLPEGTTSWFINVTDGDAIASSRYQDAEGATNLFSPGTDLSPYAVLGDAEPENTREVVAEAGDDLRFEPVPKSGGSWSWCGPAGFESSKRSPSLEGLQSRHAGEYIATYTDAEGNICRDTFVLEL